MYLSKKILLLLLTYFLKILTIKYFKLVNEVIFGKDTR